MEVEKMIYDQNPNNIISEEQFIVKKLNQTDRTTLSKSNLQTYGKM
jgi:hypothetical protein